MPIKNDISILEFNTDTTNTTVYVIACNKAKVCTEPVKYIVKVDVSTPTTPTVSTGIKACGYALSRNVTVTSKSTSISGISYYEYYLSKSTTKPAADVDGAVKVSSNEFTVSTPGTYIFVRGVNNVGTKSAWSGAAYLCNDTNTVPVPTVTASDNISSGYWHGTAFNLNISDSLQSVGLQFYYGTSENSIKNKVSNDTVALSAVTDGTTYYFKACKNYNDKICSDVSAYTVKLDSKTPAITVNGALTTWATSRTLTITPTATSGVERYEYIIANEAAISNYDDYEKQISRSNILNITTTGKFIYIRAINNLNIGGSWTKFNLYVDSTIPAPPTITAKDGIESGAWHTSAQNITLSGSTALSTVTYYYGFSVDSITTSGSIPNSNNNLKNNTNGVTIYAKACSKSGLCSEISTYEYKLDKSTLGKITVTGGDNIWSTSSKEYTVETTNNTDGKTPFSGWKGFEYYISNSSTVTSTVEPTGTFTDNTITINIPGQYIYFRDSSVANKKSAYVKANLYIDQEEYPALTVTTTDNIASGSWRTAKTDIIFDDPLPTIDKTYYYYYINNSTQVQSKETALNATKLSITTDTDNTYYFRYCRSDSNKSVCSPYTEYNMRMNIKTITIKVSGTSTTWTTSRTLTLSATTYSDIVYYEYYLSNDNKIDTEQAEIQKVKITDNVLTIDKTYQYIYFKATNQAGVTSAWTAANNLYVDSTKPSSPTITAEDEIASGAWHTKATKLTFSSEKTLSGISYKYGTSEDAIKTAGTSIAANNAILSSSVADKKIYVIACNAAGLCSDPSIYVYNMDKNTPKSPTIKSSATTWQTQARTYTITPPTSASGIAHYEYYISSSTTAPNASVEPTATFILDNEENETTIATPGKYIYFRAVNNLGVKGNWSSAINHYVEYAQLNSPSIQSADSIASGEWHTKAQNITLTGTNSTGGTNYYYGFSEDSVTTSGTTIASSNSNLKSSTDGVTIYAKACSKNITDLCSEISTYEYKLDSSSLSAPTIKIDSTDWKTASEGKTITITPTTSTTPISGILGYEYYITTTNTAPATTVTATGIVDKDNLTPIIYEPGLYIYFREVNVAGTKVLGANHKVLNLIMM